ncbi:hypothetical protein C8R44DRAFT_872318 [Mycena epipterygia]|nr:hypothetical protein C8R44DRAFT_872318 [Mycena epipterygia]
MGANILLLNPHEGGTRTAWERRMIRRGSCALELVIYTPICTTVSTRGWYRDSIRMESRSPAPARACCSRTDLRAWSVIVRPTTNKSLSSAALMLPSACRRVPALRDAARWRATRSWRDWMWGSRIPCPVVHERNENEDGRLLLHLPVHDSQQTQACFPPTRLEGAGSPVVRDGCAERESV